jgi:hypothetical protein
MFALTMTKAQKQTLESGAICLPSPVFPHVLFCEAFLKNSSLDIVAVGITEGHLELLENYSLVTLYFVYREVLQSFKYIINTFFFD